ncbi:MAG: hypothetical protein V4677_02645 [Bacteroidota bacterium]
MNAITTYLFQTKKQTREVGWFRNALYLFLLYKVFVYIYQFQSLFSEDRLIYSNVKHINTIVDAVFFLNNHYSVFLGSFFIIAVVIITLIGLLKRSSFITNIILWWLVMNLTNFLYPTLTAGDFLLNQLLLFNCFFSLKKTDDLIINDLKTAFHNTALIGIKLQICLAYFLSAYYKLTEDSWINGGALHTIFQIPEFSNTLLASIPSVMCMVLTYLTIAYQLSFPVLVWFRPFKIWLFSFGILQHLVIALGMGLFQFGIIMIICYILFLKYDDRTEKENTISNN